MKQPLVNDWTTEPVQVDHVEGCYSFYLLSFHQLQPSSVQLYGQHQKAFLWNISIFVPDALDFSANQNTFLVIILVDHTALIKKNLKKKKISQNYMTLIKSFHGWHHIKLSTVMWQNNDNTFYLPEIIDLLDSLCDVSSCQSVQSLLQPSQTFLHLKFGAFT